MNENRHSLWYVYVSAQEGWYHLIAILVFIPGANFLLVGARYLSDWRIFLQASGLVTGLYVPIALMLTIIVRVVIQRFPAMSQTLSRVGAMLVLTALVTSLYATMAVWIISRVSALNVSFSGENVQILMSLGLLFDLLFCITHGYFYARSMWHEEQLENEQLKKSTAQNQLEALKTRVNPHFLFNSLTSLSSLIGEDSQSAERFVDEMAKVYRYLLQADKQELAPLSAELAFINSYAYLLKTRYGNGISVNISISPSDSLSYLPPLTLLILIENAVKHNAILPSQPLRIEIAQPDFESLVVRNNLQKRPLRVEVGGLGLSSVMTSYQKWGKEISVQDTGESFSVFLPLLPAQTPL